MVLFSEQNLGAMSSKLSEGKVFRINVVYLCILYVIYEYKVGMSGQVDGRI